AFIMELSKGESNISIIELDLIPIADHENKVYCKCFLCAEEGYDSAWVSKKLSQTSEPSSDENDVQINNYKIKSDPNYNFSNVDVNTDILYEIQDSFLPDIDIEIQNLSETPKYSEISQESSDSEYSIQENFSDCNSALNDLSSEDSEDNYSDYSKCDDFFDSESFEDNYSDYSPN
ncbi:13980_t:CDS:2, partial [Racocetra fulgida]